ncbi:unnamed protein product [Paramecium sonneborni]|uniref:Uncharacterized protein n=1 Tax=Paramecium sonneborni TaxID=65129 RepID=A0A8S1JZ09_9CILI|nr:unnamed protein product [Paramecium sonneborni]
MSQETLMGQMELWTGKLQIYQKVYQTRQKRIYKNCNIMCNAVMGAVGYFIKLVFIPINNIILSAN